MRVVSSWLRADDGGIRRIVTVNPEFIVTARRDTEFRDALVDADLATADGVGILVGARILGRRVRQRVTGVELTELLADMDDPRPRLFLLGARPGVAEIAAQRLQRDHPGVEIAGTYSGSPRGDERRQILGIIKASGADTLLVAFGAPEQDKWIARYRSELAACGIVVAIGVGGTFDYLSGTVPRAPAFIRRAGLEWLYRLIRQPWRWRRQLALPLFVLLVLRERLSGKA